MIIRVIDTILYMPSFLVAYSYLIKKIGGQISVPVIDQIPPPLVGLLTFALSAYWLARAFSTGLKAWGDFEEKKHMNETVKIQNDKLRRRDVAQKEAILTTNDQLKEIERIRQQAEDEVKNKLKKWGIE
jgi:hypothetical protein